MFIYHRLVYKTIFCCALGLIGILPQSFLAREVKPPYDAKAKVHFLRQILEQKQKIDYRVMEVDLFESKEPYRAYAPSNMLTDLRYVEKTPTTPIFQEEALLITEHISQKAAFRKSLFIQTSFTHPGRETFLIKPSKPIALLGRPVQALLWVHSQNYPCRFVLRFQNAKGKKFSVSLGSLTWHGWRKWSVNLPPSSFASHLRIRNERKPYFIGFQLVSFHSSSKKSISLLLDNFLIVYEKRDMIYPGSEIKDDWN